MLYKIIVQNFVLLICEPLLFPTWVIDVDITSHMWARLEKW